MNRKSENLVISHSIGIGGEYKLDKILPTGEVVPLTDWFSNLITNSGLDAVCRDFYNISSAVSTRAYCLIGTGTAAPQVTDTQLAQYVEDTISASSTTYEAGGAPYYWHQISRTFQFPLELTGNFTEVGIASSSPGYDSYQLWSRELIRDSQGNPTTITVLADEILQVTYRLRMYPPLDDVVGQFVLNGNTYDYIMRAALADVGDHWACGGSIGSPVTFYGNTDTSGNRIPTQAYSGDIGDILSIPSGSSSNRSSVITLYDDYVRGSFELFARFIWGLQSGNFPGGLRSMLYTTRTTWTSLVTATNAWGAYQVQFDPPIPKDDTLIFEITVGISINRHTPPE